MLCMRVYTNLCTSKVQARIALVKAKAHEASEKIQVNRFILFRSQQSLVFELHYFSKPILITFIQIFLSTWGISLIDVFLSSIYFVYPPSLCSLLKAKAIEAAKHTSEVAHRQALKASEAAHKQATKALRGKKQIHPAKVDEVKTFYLWVECKNFDGVLEKVG